MISCIHTLLLRFTAIIGLLEMSRVEGVAFRIQGWRFGVRMPNAWFGGQSALWGSGFPALSPKLQTLNLQVASLLLKALPSAFLTSEAG